MSEPPDPDSRRDENYRAEYDVVASGWRFFVSLRFIVTAFAITLQSGLFTLYNQLQQAAEEQRLLQNAIIPLVGLFSIIAVSLIEVRNIELFRLTIQRGSELEFHLGLADGYFHRLAEPVRVKPEGLNRLFTHTWGITLIYSGIYALWLTLAYVAFTN